jgi:hypothetical protein
MVMELFSFSSTSFSEIPLAVLRSRESQCFASYKLNWGYLQDRFETGKYHLRRLARYSWIDSVVDDMSASFVEGTDKVLVIFEHFLDQISVLLVNSQDIFNKLRVNLEIQTRRWPSM